MRHQYIKKGPETPYAKAEENGRPMRFQTSLGELVWIYPMREMTEEQLLQVIDAAYGGVERAYVTPAEDELTGKEALARAKELVKGYITDTEVSDIYMGYYGGENGAELSRGLSLWMAQVHVEGGDHDYRLQFDADNGNLLEWVSTPPDFYTEEGYSAEALRNGNASLETAGEVTEEELLETARNYWEKVKDFSQTEGEADWIVVDTGDAQKSNAVMGKFGEKYVQIVIDPADMTVSRVTIKENK